MVKLKAADTLGLSFKFNIVFPHQLPLRLDLGKSTSLKVSISNPLSAILLYITQPSKITLELDVTLIQIAPPFWALLLIIKEFLTSILSEKITPPALAVLFLKIRSLALILWLEKAPPNWALFWVKFDFSTVAWLFANIAPPYW